MKKILYVISYDYLSVPIFNSIASILGKDYKHVIVYFPEPFYIQDSTKISNKIENQLFDEISIINPSEINYVNRVLKKRTLFINHFKIIISLKKYKNKLLGILSEISPDMIVATTDLSFISRILSEHTKRRNIPFILMQPSFLHSPHKSLLKQIKSRLFYVLFNGILGIPLMNKQEEWGDEAPESLKLLWGDNFKNLLKSEKVKIAGNPGIRKYYNLDLVSGKKLKCDLNIGETTPVITICTEGFGVMINEEEINIIYKEAIISCREYHFIIKVHPRDEISFYREYFTGKGINNVTVVKEIPLLDLYGLTDVQISVNSYSSLEAILCGIPVILVKRDVVNSTNYFDNSVVINVDDTISLKENLKKCLSEEYKSEFLINREKYILKLFGNLNPDQTDKNIREAVENSI